MKKIFLILLALIISISTVSALSSIELIRYDPVPAQAGEYVDVWIKFQNKGDMEIPQAKLRFKQSYPFSLDPTEKAEVDLGTIKGDQFTIHKFKVRVDKSAIEGENDIHFEYWDSGLWEQKSFKIDIQETHTKFEIVVQELGKEGTSIAIANIGKNPANSITIKIPEQQDIEVKGISSTIIGNLYAGDYTIATYNLLPKNPENNLEVEIHYTDSLGERHIITKTVQFMSKKDFYEIYNRVHGLDKTGGFSFWFYITLILLAYIIAKFIKHRRDRKKKRK